MTFKNILSSALNRKMLPVMLRKLGKRLKDEKGLLSTEENVKWIRSHCSKFELFAKERDEELWVEAELFGNNLQGYAGKKFSCLKIHLGGGGAYSFLYFLTRYIKPKCIVETGVSAGYSSSAFLSAIKANGKGKLYSSDFPCFRFSQPEKYIGLLVEEGLKENWELYIDGDEVNLPKILHKVEQVDLFHYDSDKSYSGRTYAMTMIEKKMSKTGVLVIDDIQDNSQFHDYVETRNIDSWDIFEFEGKYLGMIGEATKNFCFAA